MSNEYNKYMDENLRKITVKLKPCPFCGGEAIVCKVQTEPGVKIECERCGIGTPWYWSGAAQARKWNKRNGDKDDEKSAVLKICK